VTRAPTPIRPARAPVSERSRFGRLPAHPYTEVDGHPVVLALDRRRFHVLTPAGARLWGALDGRPLGEVVDDLAGPGTDPRAEGIELIRRWRALHLVEEGLAGDEAVDDLGDDAAASAMASVSFRGVAADSGAILRVGERADERPTVSLRPPRVIGADRPLEGVVEVVGSGARGGSIGVLEVFGALLASVVDEDLLDAGLGDALAGLAEGLPGRRVALG
jgi:hypothetical protein